MAILDARPTSTSSPATAGTSAARSTGSSRVPSRSAARPDLASILADEWSVFIMAVFRRRVYTTVGTFDEEMRSNEDYDFWLRAAIAGWRLRA
jgi:GT2 family glycosyltransferase